MHGEDTPKLKIEKIRQNIHDQISQKIEKKLEDVKLKDKADNKDVKDEETTTTSDRLLAIGRCQAEGQGRQ